MGLSQRLRLNAAVDPAQGGALWRLRDGLGAAVPGVAGNSALLTALQEALVADGDAQGFMALDGQMHEMMLSFTGFPRLPHVSQTAWLNVHRARQLILPVEGRLQATLEEHRAILAAFEAHDPQAARRAVQHHLRQLLTYLQPLERERPDLFLTQGQS